MYNISVCVYMVLEMSAVCLRLAAFTAHHKQAITPCNGTVCMAFRNDSPNYACNSGSSAINCEETKLLR
jgi:hypothetical protein